LNEFTNSCEFVLVNQGGEGEEDVVWDRKLVTKEYAEAGTPGEPGQPGQPGQPGESGKAGADGPVVYPAGV
jgi:hypothetical protein